MRRGDLSAEMLALLAFFAVGLVVLVIWLSGALFTASNTKDIEACRASVEGYAMLQLDLPGADANLMTPDCTRRVITFTKNAVEMNGKKARFFDPRMNQTVKQYAKLTPEIVNSVAASELSVCWYEFLEGKSYWVNEVDINDNDVGCFVCGELRFSKEATFDVTTQTLLFDYLETHESRPYPSLVKEKPTYLEYLYLQPRICDHSGTSSENTVGEWYEKSDSRSCEQQFFDKVLAVGPQTVTREYSTKDEGKVTTPVNLPAPAISMYDLKLTPDKSYMIIFYQLGEDKNKGKDGSPEGTTYAPILIPSEKFSTEMCETFLG